MRTIHKFQIHAAYTTHLLPADARVVLVGTQPLGPGKSSVPMVWFELDTNKPKVTRSFSVYPTGAEIPEHAVYCGSWMRDIFVWHLYEVTANA